MRIITHEWLEMNATGRASWTREQLRLVGVSWPPKKGWKWRIVGGGISDESATKFEAIGAEARKRHAMRLVLRTW